MDIVERANESGAIITRYFLNGNITKTEIKAMFHQFEHMTGEDNTLNEIRYAQEGAKQSCYYQPESFSFFVTGDSKQHYETLLYKSVDGKCGVFFVEPPRHKKAYYELRLKNSAIDEGPSEDCLQEFKSNLLRNETGRSSYHPDCQCILEEINYSSLN
ncbi:hypothetical protein V5799_003347 [Amblyomma americanum]|uniref:Uncharacterized protein n=1 Tax=Amblyomma americanum TaxID=6943 RepID=A0AAQ4D983_AMBAM